MTHEYLLWISLFAYVLHIYEEHSLNWKEWASTTLHLRNLTWNDFYVTNSIVIVGGLCTAMVGWQLPFFALILPALQLINGLFFHIFPTIFLAKFSPGVITSTVLFLPIGIITFWGAHLDHALSGQAIFLTFLCAAILMSLPFVFLKLRSMLS